ncbi:MAG: DUF86 domain-containing protein [Gammaproteobacteria bacterium]|nr:DUF86 domain-containing protein [Gammaproteobacteria bacterium]
MSKPFQDQHPEVPWRNTIGQRNVLAHQYGKIGYDLLYPTATRDVLRCIEVLPKLLPPSFEFRS